MPYRDGGNHSSLAQLLKDLEKRAEGGAATTEAVGSTISRPLHVVLQVSNVTWDIIFCRCCKILSTKSLAVFYALAHVYTVDHVMSSPLHVVLHAITVIYYRPHDQLPGASVISQRQFPTLLQDQSSKRATAGGPLSWVTSLFFTAVSFLALAMLCALGAATIRRYSGAGAGALAGGPAASITGPGGTSYAPKEYNKVR